MGVGEFCLPHHWVLPNSWHLHELSCGGCLSGLMLILIQKSSKRQSFNLPCFNAITSILVEAKRLHFWSGAGRILKLWFCRDNPITQLLSSSTFLAKEMMIPFSRDQGRVRDSKITWQQSKYNLLFTGSLDICSPKRFGWMGHMVIFQLLEDCPRASVSFREVLECYP